MHTVAPVSPPPWAPGSPQQSARAGGEHEELPNSRSSSQRMYFMMLA
jgi:hypothetical protein